MIQNDRCRCIADAISDKLILQRTCNDTIPQCAGQGRRPILSLADEVVVEDGSNRIIVVIYFVATISCNRAIIQLVLPALQQGEGNSSAGMNETVCGGHGTTE